MAGIEKRYMDAAIEAAEPYSDDWLRGYAAGIKDTADTLREELTRKVDDMIAEYVDATANMPEVIAERARRQAG